MQLKGKDNNSPSLNSNGEVCTIFPSHIKVGGISLNLEEPQWWFDNPSTLLQWQLVVFLSLIGIIRLFLKRFGVSKFSCQLIAGLIVGCSWKHWDVLKFQFFTEDSEDAMGLLAYFGYTLFLFISGVKIDLVTALKTDKKALKIGIPMFFTSVTSAYIVSAVLSNGIEENKKTILPILISFHTQTAFPVVASLISELKIVNSEVGRLALSSALVSNMLSLLLMVASSAFIKLKTSASGAYLEFIGVIVLFVLVWFVFRSLMLRILEHSPSGKSVGQKSIQGIIFFAVLSSALFSFTTVSTLTGPYILGLAIPDAAPLASTLVNRAESFIMNILSPIMVVTCGLRMDLLKMATAAFTPFTRLNVVLLFVTYVVKLVTCLLSLLYCKFSFKEGLAVSLMITCKGIVELVFYALALDKKGIDSDLYSYLILSLLVISTFVPIAVRYLYDPSSKYAGYHNSDMLHLNPNSELRMLTCLHRDENVHGIVHLLNITCPTVDNPLAVYVLHLIELVGRTNPVFISHKSHKNTLHEAHAYSENIILSFEHYAKHSDGTVHIECFTGISPNKFMQDDICTLALENRTSLIILPFHQTWTADGLIAQDDNTIRSLNNIVLEKAPCSIGILANRGNFESMAAWASPEKTSKYSVCVIYLGGNDDRESISFASRMSKDSRVELTLLRLKSLEEDDLTNWENMLNAEIIKHFKLNCVEQGSAKYIEEISRDGPETALKIRQIVNDYDLIIVGRRHGVKSPQTSGLSDWNEFPELGILGDLVISPDIEGRASVLVIQRQMFKHA